MGLFTQFNVPPEMLEYNQWLCWKSAMRNGKQTKIPIDPNTGEFGRANDSRTWTNYQSAKDFSDQNNIGLGFVFTEDDPFVGVDLDDYRYPDADDGDVCDPVAENIIQTLASYSEVSPSGTGYHVIVKGELPDGRNRRGDIEMYDHGRFFTFTGERVPETNYNVEERQKELQQIHAQYLAEPEDVANTTDATPSEDLDIDDEQVVKKAKNAANGDTFEDLWNGRIGGYDSHSEADLALCSYLSFWTGGDKKQMDRLFRDSGLMRAKWDNVHSSNGDTYGDMTIDKAVRTCSDFYDGA